MSWLLDMRPRGAGGGSVPVAPVDATYITQTPNATLTNEQALSLLATGLLKNTTGTGVLSIGVPTVDFASAAQGALADTALQPADIGVSVQAWDTDLTTLAGLTHADGNFIVSDGGAWTVESGAVARASLGLGTIATQAANSVTISGGSITGITDLAIADGGTGASDAATARTNLGLVAGGTGDIWVEKAGDTMTGDLTVQGNAAVALTVQGVAAQNVLAFKDSGGTTRSTLDSTAYGLRVGDTIDRGNISIGAQVPSNNFGIRIDRRVDAATANLFGISGEMSTVGILSGTVNIVAGLSFSGRGNHSSGTVANLYGVDSLVRNNSTGAVTNMFGVRIQTPVNSGGGTVSQVYGLRILDQIVGTSQAYAIQTNAGMVIFNDGGDSISEFRVEGDTDQFLITTDPATDRLGIGTGTPSNKFHVLLSSAATNAIANVARLTHNSTGTAAAGFGTGLIFGGESSTTNDQDMARISALWNVATHASRVVDLVAEVNYSGGAVEVWRGRGGSSPLLSFLGATPIARPASYTLASTAGRVLPTPEATFTGQDNAQAGSVYAKSADIITLQTRLNSVEGVLRQLIIDLASTSGYGLLVAS